MKTNIALESEVDKHIKTLFSGAAWGTWGKRKSWEARGHGTNTMTSSFKRNKTSFLYVFGNFGEGFIV